AAGGCRRSMPAQFSQIMTRMLRTLIAAAALVALPLGTPAAQKVAPLAPQDLAQIWDAEHVSPPLPPLLEHDEVERRLKGVVEADPSHIFSERVGESLEGRSINLLSMGS